MSTAASRPTRVDELLDSRLMAKLDQLDVVSRKIFAGKLQGERRSKRRGMSVEFADYRHYVHGDDLRFVDWNIYARLDRLFLKLFLEEDVFASVGNKVNKKELAFGDQADDGNDYLIYNQGKGKLWYDEDAKGGSAKVLVAKLKHNPDLDHKDFMVGDFTI